MSHRLIHLASQRGKIRCKPAAVVTVALSLVLAATAAQAGTITFSGRNFDTYDHVFAGQYEPDQSNQYVTPDANTGVMTGRFGTDGGDDSFMTTPITVSVGDKVSYNYHLTELNRDFGGDGGSTWLGDSRSGFQDTSGNWATGRIATYNSRWEQYFEGNNPGYGFSARGPNDYFTAEWTFTSTTTATVTLTIQGQTTPYATFTDSFSDIANIAKFRVGLWDSEQDVTLSNFVHTPVPEPAAVTMLGVACLGLLGQRRRILGQHTGSTN
jgi:hypothetical protein